MQTSLLLLIMVDYLVFLTISASLYAIFALGLNLQWGFTGLINFGHVAFMTIGAYTTVLLSDNGVPIFLAVIIGAVGASVFGLLIGLTSIKLREDYLAIVTIGAGELVRLFVQNEEWLTRGTFGIQGYDLPLGSFKPNDFGKLFMIICLTLLAVLVVGLLWRNIQQQLNLRRTIQGKGYQPPSPLTTYLWGGFAFILILLFYLNGVSALSNYTDKAGLMLLILVGLALVYYGLDVLVHSPWGRVLKAIREDEEVAKALGKNVFYYKLQAFMLGGAIAGIAGAFYAWQLTTIYPSSFEPLRTFDAWIVVVLGGAGNNAGVILGAIIFWGYDSLTRFTLTNIPFITITESQIGAFRVMVIGLILMILMILRPQGILGNKDELSLGK